MAGPRPLGTKASKALGATVWPVSAARQALRERAGEGGKRTGGINVPV
jgi:hypothetical protein